MELMGQGLVLMVAGMGIVYAVVAGVLYTLCR
jgi:Na+-transporting methylmalonyl-CoA/oxaloacetate decarboxylase gamma subunit